MWSVLLKGCIITLVAAIPLLTEAEMIKARDGSGFFGYKDTPKLPWCGYVMHDPDRPIPPIVDPGPEQPPLPAPSDAIVLFDGKDLSAWLPNDTWKLEHGQIVAGEGKLTTRALFGDVQIHAEWLAPTDFNGPWYGAGNNGVTLMDQFEIQTFDSYLNRIPLYADGQCAAIYGQTPPQVNACRAPGQWQSFDIFFTAPVFKKGKLYKPARLTLLHNGVLAHLDQEIYGETHHCQFPVYVKTDPQGPISLPAHHCAVRFRNIWARPIKTSPVLPDAVTTPVRKQEKKK